MSIIVITGASRGIGASPAIQCARRGMGVVVTYRSDAAGAEAVVRPVEAAGGKAAAVPLDVGNVASFQSFRDALAAALKNTWGRDSFDGLVNNTGYGTFNPIESAQPTTQAA
jgi:NAD(P)-dependent dehydrogenase (short-subunit alcohol dehydrogenase family)